MSGTWGAVLLGLCGALVPEILRAITALRAGRAPTRYELGASVLATLLGLGVLLFDTSNDSRLEVAVLGAAFPQIFSGLVAAAKAPHEAPFRTQSQGERRHRSLLDYLAWRI